MNKNIQLLDCTLRDGAYIVNAKFGTPAIKGIIKRMEDANIDIIECGWLKDTPHEIGTTFFHTPRDLEQYLVEKKKHATYVAMIDWDRYDLSNLPEYDGKSIDAIRVVFPQGKFREGIALGKVIKEKGYKVYFQAANTLGYSDAELIQLAEEINKAKPVAISVVDTFGAMYWEDLNRIVSILDNNLDKDIKLGFHSHNNQQLSFSLSMQFIEKLYYSDRKIIVDSSLCGMGRGAGNTTTELMVNFLNKKYKANYDMNIVMDAIDTYMGYFLTNYKWGYSTPYLISGIYCAHVNNIAYLTENHRANYKDMRNVIESLSESDRKKYDYDLLEQKYIDYQNKMVDDEDVLIKLEKEFQGRKVVLISPGKSIIECKEEIQQYIESEKPVVIGINAVSSEYKYDYVFFSNKIRYEYAKEIYSDLLEMTKRIVVSSIKTHGEINEDIVNFNLLIKRGWKHFDNAVIMCLRLLNKLHVTDIALAGFDGFSNQYSESYFDVSLPSLNTEGNWEELNKEIKSMFQDFKEVTADSININFITKSIYE